MKSKLYFFHIHKVGGNSLVKVLRKGYSENEILPVGLWREIIALPREEIMRYRFFSGHFGTGLYSLLKEEPPTVTLLRDPSNGRSHRFFTGRGLRRKTFRRESGTKGFSRSRSWPPRFLPAPTSKRPFPPPWFVPTSRTTRPEAWESPST